MTSSFLPAIDFGLADFAVLNHPRGVRYGSLADIRGTN
jgi:hypothetical protein